MNALERGEQLARRKGLYEAKHPEAKHGGDRKSEKAKNQDADSAPRSFTQDTASKTSQSARTISEDVQIATDIPEEIRDAIRDTPVADNKEELLMPSLFLSAQSKAAGAPRTLPPLISQSLEDREAAP